MSKQTVAILGASADRRKFGNKSVRAHLETGWTVFPINPKGGEIEGLRTYQSLTDVPVDRLDRVSVYLPPPLALGVLPAIASLDVDEVWFNPGADGEQVLQEAERLRLPFRAACSIIALGVSPSQFGD